MKTIQIKYSEYFPSSSSAKSIFQIVSCCYAIDQLTHAYSLLCNSSKNQQQRDIARKRFPNDLRSMMLLKRFCLSVKIISIELKKIWIEYKKKAKTIVLLFLIFSSLCCRCYRLTMPKRMFSQECSKSIVLKRLNELTYKKGKLLWDFYGNILGAIKYKDHGPYSSVLLTNWISK